MPDSEQKKRFRELLGQLIDEELGQDELRELTDLVKTNPDFSDELRDQLSVHNQIAQYENQGHSAEIFTASVCNALEADQDGAEFVSNVLKMTPDEEDNRRVVTPWLVALGSLAACIAFALLWFFSTDSSLDETTAPGVAVIESLIGTVEFDQAPRAEGDSVGEGLLEIDGYAALEFYKGARMTVAGPAKLELVTPQRVICHFGKIRTVVPVVAKGFTVVTAESEVVDLGTEFAMDVSESGKTEVHVFDGEVEAYDTERTLESKQLLTAGAGIKIQKDKPWESIPAEISRFDDLSNITQLAADERERQYTEWLKINTAAKNDPRLIAYYDFEREMTKARL